MAVGQSSSREGVLGGGEQRRDGLVAVELVGGLGDLGEQEHELGEVGVDADQPRAGEAGGAVGYAERQARDACRR